MPFMLSLSFPDDPCLGELLCENVAIHLYKRVGVANRTSKEPGGIDFTERNTLVSSAKLRKNTGWAEGVIVLKGEIQTGSAGAEMSWSLPNNAHTKVSLAFGIHFLNKVLTRTPVYFPCVSTTAIQFRFPYSRFHTRGRDKHLHEQLGHG
jgi:hypothetical protein